MKKLLFVIVLLLAGYQYLFYQDGSVLDEVQSYELSRSIDSTVHSAAFNEAQSSATLVNPDSADAVISDAFANRKSNLQVSGYGTVIKLLPDDLSGSKHQKFIIKLDSEHTLLVSHNFDLAPRLSSIKIGDVIQFNGEYEWNNKGGVIHWTHGDPRGLHVAGWLKHNGRIYQ
ncbi:MAG: DUF3465 domain-containing protein [Sulfurimonas sp.]|jgi:hypothetical protein